jgi:hypothetical protein
LSFPDKLIFKTLKKYLDNGDFWIPGNCRIFLGRILAIGCVCIWIVDLDTYFAFPAFQPLSLALSPPGERETLVNNCFFDCNIILPTKG